MTEVIKNTLPKFLHWEANKAKSRELVKVAAATTAGDLLIKTSSGFKPFKGTALTPDAATTGIVVAVALEDGAYNATIACVVRDAVLIQDKLNSIAADTFDAGKPLAAIAPLLEAQQLVAKSSINISRAQPVQPPPPM